MTDENKTDTTTAKDERRSTRRGPTLAVGIFIGACAIFSIYYAMTHHVIQTDGEKLVVRRAETGKSNLFVDIQGWKLQDYLANPLVSQALYQAGHAPLLVKSCMGGENPAFVSAVLSAGAEPTPDWLQRRHFIFTKDEGLLVLPKLKPGVEDTFADVRTWSYATFDEHAALKQALIDGGHRKLVLAAKLNEVKDNVGGAVKGFADKLRGKIHKMTEKDEE